EGSPRLLRPYGYYGGVLGVVLGCLAARLALGTDAWLLLGAYAVAGPWIQAAGRVRCLVQGCCHGAPAPESVGIRYVHPRSRVCRLSSLAGIPVHPTPLYSIVWNAVPALLCARLWGARSPLSVIAGAYLILTGLGRFVEESRRGEPQTPVFARLRLYQWIAAGTVAAGAVFTCLPGTAPAPAPEPSPAALGAAAVFAAATWFALGVDFPRSNRRFARLV
ncbi:MAG TPA: prolipoprotein diacylglyceryl transferase family protein, partial [Thermoanaerobaculia bacterium]|nr:prolipoprotein diacylglyceryl transferase family protein [Thermoanaerobaculia bacterium]